MCNVVNKHSICNLAHCARYFQSLNHTVSRDCVHTLVLQHTDVYTNGFSRTHFVSCCKKQAELNVSASADILTNTAITGDDDVVCVFAHTHTGSTQHMKEPTCKVCSSRCGCPVSLTWFISCSYSACTFEHTHIQHTHVTVHTHIWVYACRERTNTHCHAATLAHACTLTSTPK